MPLIDTGKCSYSHRPHVKCNNPTWKRAFFLSFKDENQPVPDHTGEPDEFEFWLSTWYQGNDENIIGISRASWRASRIALRASTEKFFTNLIGKLQ